MTVVLCSIFAAGLLASCRGGEDTGGTPSDASRAMNAVAASANNVGVTQQEDEGDDDDAQSVVCRGTADGTRTSGPVTIPKGSRGVVLTLNGSGRQHELWVRRKLPRDATVTMTERQGRVPGVEIRGRNIPQDKRWAILVLDISGCDVRDDYFVAKRETMKSRTGTLDMKHNRVSGWIKGASGYILAQGIVKILPDTLPTPPPDSTSPPAR
jgi:hypothetical protein